MTGPEHYAKAEALLGNAWERLGAHGFGDYLHPAETRAALIAQAQVHATLALAAARSTPSIPPGPCPVRSPQFTVHGRPLPREFCDLLAGHAGLHVAGASVWSEGIE